MKTRIDKLKKGKSILVTFHDGFWTYVIAIPKSCAIRFFSEGLDSAVSTLLQSSELQTNLSEKDVHKDEIQEG